MVFFRVQKMLRAALINPQGLKKKSPYRLKTRNVCLPSYRKRGGA
jgi:hypothetical protein